jgi:hypothetical protein
MIKVSSRFLAVLILAVLAFPSVTTTSALAAGLFLRNSVRTTERLTEIGRPYGHGGTIENGFERGGGKRGCDLACEIRSLTDAPPRQVRIPKAEEKSDIGLKSLPPVPSRLGASGLRGYLHQMP